MMFVVLKVGILLAVVGSSWAQAVNGQAISFTCTTCHGPSGKSIGAVPSLYGLTQEEIETAFKEFRSGKREATIMNRIVDGYTEDEIKAVAKYFSDLSKGER